MIAWVQIKVLVLDPLWAMVTHTLVLHSSPTRRMRPKPKSSGISLPGRCLDCHFDTTQFCLKDAQKRWKDAKRQQHSGPCSSPGSGLRDRRIRDTRWAGADPNPLPRRFGAGGTRPGTLGTG